MIKGIDQIGIAVKDIERSVAALCAALDIPAPSIVEIPERRAKMAQLHFGAVSLEFVQDESEEGRFALFVQKKGNGLHHFCLVTDDIDGEIEAFRRRGVEMEHQQPVLGLRGKRIAYT